MKILDEQTQKEPRFFTRERKLMLSVMVGWGLITLMVIFPLLGSLTNMIYLDNAIGGLLFCAIFFAIRYSLMKPVLKVGFSGLKTVGLIHILDMTFSRRNGGGAATMGAFIGAALIFMGVLILNGLKGFVFLIQETKVFVSEFETIKASVKIKRPAA